jgi:hypothetical protein
MASAIGIDGPSTWVGEEQQEPRPIHRGRRSGTGTPGVFAPPGKAPGGGGKSLGYAKKYRLINAATSTPIDATCSQRWRGQRPSANNEPATHATIEGKIIPPPLTKKQNPTTAIAINVPTATKKLRPRVFTVRAWSSLEHAEIHASLRECGVQPAAAGHLDCGTSMTTADGRGLDQIGRRNRHTM